MQFGISNSGFWLKASSPNKADRGRNRKLRCAVFWFAAFYMVAERQRHTSSKHLSELSDKGRVHERQEWAPSDKQIIAVVDASWSVRSVMGGIILCCGAAVKVWSRRIQTACLSSAEAELHAIAEGCKESLAVGIALQTCLEGLPKRDWLGIPVTTRGDYPLLLYTDSESGQHISNMQGLLRRIKHVELRALLVQELTESGRLKVYFVAGSANPSDAHTKSSDKRHVLLLILALGMSEGDLDAQIASWADQVVSVLGPVSPQNRRRITEGIQRGLARVVPRSSVCLSQDPVSSKP